MAPQRTTIFSNDGLRFQVVDEGPMTGEPVVLLHGFPQRATAWTGVAERLHEHGLRTLAPDLRGYSPQARPARRRDYRLPLLVGDVVALLRLTGPAHLVGHDWGAAIAWSTAASHGDLVRTLTTVSVPHPAAFLASMLRGDQLRRSWYMGFFQLPWLPERLLSRASASSGALRRMGMDEEMVRAYREQVVADGALPGGLGYYRALPLADPRRSAGPVRVPTTHVWSDRDPALGRAGAELTGRYVDADYRLEVLPGVSHWIPEQAPDRLARIIAERAGAVPAR